MTVLTLNVTLVLGLLKCSTGELGQYFHIVNLTTRGWLQQQLRH